MEFIPMIEACKLADWTLLGLFVVALAIQLWYYLAVYLKVARHRNQEPATADQLPPVSVIICARNEEENLQRFLPGVLDQDYPEFEVIVVNDGSTDNSEELLSEIKAKYARLHYTNIPVSQTPSRGKKLAVTIGVKAASHEHLVLTDADCFPESPQWLQRMAGHFNKEKRMVLGYGGYQRRRGLLNLLIRFETLNTAMLYLGWALRGKPYMGVGRNLAYEKALFFESKGFASHLRLRSGDDDLFVNENANAKNTAAEFSPESFTRSVPETRFRDWVRQKRRHLSAGSHYTRSSRIRLATEWISRLLFHGLFIYLVITSPLQVPVAGLYALALFTRSYVLIRNIRRLKENYLFLPSLLLDPLMPLILGTIWLASLFEPKN